MISRELNPFVGPVSVRRMMSRKLVKMPMIYALFDVLRNVPIACSHLTSSLATVLRAVSAFLSTSPYAAVIVFNQTQGDCIKRSDK